MIQFADATVVYPGGVRAMDDLTLTINPGEFVVVGLSGAGTSTLIRAVNGLVSLASGSLTVNGRELVGASRRALRLLRGEVGMIFQSFNLVKRSTVMRNVLLVASTPCPPGDRRWACGAPRNVGVPRPHVGAVPRDVPDRRHRIGPGRGGSPAPGHHGHTHRGRRADGLRVHAGPQLRDPVAAWHRLGLLAVSAVGSGALAGIVAFWLYRFEINIRAGAILGVIGAGGIGTILSSVLTRRLWERAGVTLMAIILVTVLVDVISSKIRARIIGGSPDRTIPPEAKVSFMGG